jgi:hypothetical protein
MEHGGFLYDLARHCIACFDRLYAEWAISMGADSLVLTGSSFADSLDRIRRVCAAGIAALMLKNEARRGPVIRDIDQCRRFMDAAGG